MSRLAQDIDDLDRMVTNGAAQSDIRGQIRIVETQITALEAENARLIEENKNLVATHSLPAPQLPFEQCPFCLTAGGQLMEIKPSPIADFAGIGVKQGYYKCRNCGKEYDKEMPVS